MMDDLDPNFDPQPRARSNTWPLRPKELFHVGDEQEHRVTTTEEQQGDNENRDVIGTAPKKGTARRNAWGNLSYADLITKAIQASPEKRLTLSQIYEWMIQNVEFFKDKGESNSSAGWKNSIRHNLSLHSRFMRTQNEGTGKSSWWVINPDAKPGKSPRRRAQTMGDNKTALKQKKERLKKRADLNRAQGGFPACSPIGGSNDDLSYTDSLQLSPHGDFRSRANSNPTNGRLSPDFRARTNSTGSSIISGRLSPIQSVLEPEPHDAQMAPWDVQAHTPNFISSSGLEQPTMIDSLTNMMTDNMNGLGHLYTDTQNTLSNPSPINPALSPANTYAETQHRNSASVYVEQLSQQSPQQHSPQQQRQQQPQIINPMVLNTLNPSPQSMDNAPAFIPLNDVHVDINNQPGFQPQAQQAQQQPPMLNRDPMLSGLALKGNSDAPVLTTLNTVSSPSAFTNSNGGVGSNGIRQYQQQEPHFIQQVTQTTNTPTNLLQNSLLRKALTQKPVTSLTPQDLMAGHQLYTGNNGHSILATHNIMGANDLDHISDIPEIQSPEFIDCDVREVINHEMSFGDGGFDINFDPANNPSSTTADILRT